MQALTRRTTRQQAQIVLVAVAVLAAALSGFRYVTREGSIFSDHIVATPDAGPVGLHPSFEFDGFPDGQDVTVYLCVRATGDIADCASLGKGKAGETLRAKAVPAELPDGTTVEPGTYALRAGPDDTGEYPKRGEFEVVPFAVGSKVKAASFSSIAPNQITASAPRQIAHGIPCRPPVFLSDGRMAVGNTVIDPDTNVRVDFAAIEARELVWSPVGDKLAFLTPDRKEIRLAAPDGAGAVTRVREARGLLSSLSWSPDGAHLAYIAEPDPATRQLAGDPTAPTMTILDATRGTKAPAGPGLSVAWSPTDGNVLAVERIGAKIERSSMTGQRSALVDGRRPSWSPDGRFLAVVRGEAGAVRGHIVAVPGTGAEGGGIAITGAGGCAMSFAPSGRAVAVVADANGGTTLQLRTLSVPGAQ